LVFVLFVVILKQRGIIAEMCVLGAALGPMNTIAIIASNYRLNPTLAAQMVGIGIPLSLAVIFLVRGLLVFFGYF
jgi:hypothetical protein